MRQLLEFIWSKIDERFQSMSQAFMFFDSKNLTKLSFNDFWVAIQGLRVTLTKEEAEKVFAFLDYDKDGEIMY